MSTTRKEKQPELVPIEPVETAELSPIALSGMDPLMRLAATPGANIDAIKDLVALYREERAYQAEREFNEAFARFQEKCPPIPHNRTAKGATKSGGSFEYTYAETAQIARVVAPFLHAEGFSYSWRDEVKDKMFRSVCIVRHKGGHQRDMGEFACPIDFDNKLQSGGQATKVAQTISHRCSLISALGITTAETDTDGADMGGGPQFITEQEALDLDALCAEVGANKATLLRVFDIQSFADVRSGGMHDSIVRMLEEKRKVAK